MSVCRHYYPRAIRTSWILDSATRNTRSITVTGSAPSASVAGVVGPFPGQCRKAHASTTPLSASGPHASVFPAHFVTALRCSFTSGSRVLAPPPPLAPAHGRPQASAYKSGEVVETLKKAFMPEDGSTTMTFRNEDEVLEYLGQKASRKRGGAGRV